MAKFPLAPCTQVPVELSTKFVDEKIMSALVGLFVVIVLPLSTSAALTSVVATLIEYAVTSSCKVQIVPVEVALEASKITFWSCL